MVEFVMIAVYVVAKLKMGVNISPALKDMVCSMVLAIDMVEMIKAEPFRGTYETLMRPEPE